VIWITVQLLFDVAADSATAVSFAHHGDLTTRELGAGKQHVFEFTDGGDIVVYKEDDLLR